MNLLDDQRRIALAAFIAGLSIVDFQMRLLKSAIPPPHRPALRLVSNLHGIEVDPEFIKDTKSCDT